MLNTSDKGYEGDVSGTNKNRQNDSLKDYLDKEPMTQAKIHTEEPTTLKRDHHDHQTTSEDHIRNNTERTSEEYQKKKHTRIENDS